MEFLKNNDPDAIIIIQSDHGWSNDLDEILSDEDKIIYRAKIFNAVKARFFKSSIFPQFLQ